jgi:glycerol-3-phosphate O-acyltransferase/dihydroxyacetone phosphate acyltransferase
VDQYKKGGSSKRQAISLLLDTIYIRIKALTLQAPDFESLIVAQATRRLYQTEKLDADSALIISRRFAAVDYITNLKAYEKLKDVPKVKELTQEILKYNRMLKFYGVQDHQVKNTHISVKLAIFLTILRYLEVMMLLLITAPVFILFLPLFIVTQNVSREKAKGT